MTLEKESYFSYREKLAWQQGDLNRPWIDLAWELKNLSNYHSSEVYEQYFF